MSDPNTAIHAALDAANVPRYEDELSPMLSAVQRIALLIRDRDTQRKLLEETARGLAVERGRNMMVARYADELAHDVSTVVQHRKARDSGGQHVGTGGRLGAATPSTLVYLERFIRDLKATLDSEAGHG